MTNNSINKLVFILFLSLFCSQAIAGDRDVEEGILLYEKADKLDDRGDHKEALELYSRALTIFKNNLGSQNNYVASTLNNMGGAYKGMSDFENALKCYKDALSIREKVLGKEHQYTGSTIGNIATLLSEKGDFNESFEMFNKAISIYNKTIGQDNPNTLILNNNLASLLEKMGKYDQALQVYKRVLFLEKSSLGKDNVNTLNTIVNIANLYQERSDFKSALPLYMEALSIMKKTTSSGNSSTMTIQSNLGALYQKMGNYPKAIETLEDVLKAQKNILGDNKVECARTYNAIGNLYCEIGDYSQALENFKRANQIFEIALGKNHPDSLTSMNNVAVVLMHLNKFNEAIILMNKNLELRKEKLGDSHPDIAQAYVNIASLYQCANNITEAIRYEKLALDIYNKSLGENSPESSDIKNNLSVLLSQSDNIDEALSYAELALKSLENKVGSADPKTLNCLQNLAGIYFKKGNIDKSLECTKKSIMARQSMLKTALCMDTKSRLAWENKYLKINVEALVLNAKEIDQLILNWKGVVLDSLLEDAAVARSSQSESTANKNLIYLLKLRSQLAQLAFSSNPKDIAAFEQITADIAKAERSLVKVNSKLGYTRKSSSITVDQVATSIPDNSSVIDIIQFTDLSKTNSANCYAVSIISKNNDPQYLKIDNADVINDSVSQLRHAIVSGNQKELKKHNDILYDQLWSLIKSKIPAGNKFIYIAPDGLLNFLSFASLFDSNNKFISEDQKIYYVATGRDLVRPTNLIFNKTVAFFANPLFDSVSDSFVSDDYSKNSNEISALSHIILSPLPGTENEWNTLKPLFEIAGWKSTPFIGLQATKQNLIKLIKPGILHLATHGFYLNQLSESADHVRGLKVVEVPSSTSISQPTNSMNPDIDPMRASGIALTGAQTTLRSWGNKKSPSPDNDGVLTAENVSWLDLNGTWLVTLSACETGVGESKAGEGVFGLRRAFMMAGAQNLIMTLWPVSDEVTPLIMADFYKKALATVDAAGSFAEVQRDWLIKLRNEKGVLAAVRDVGPFAIVVMANPNAKPSSETDGVSSSLPLSDQSHSSSTSANSATQSAAMPSPVAQCGSITAILEFNDALVKADAGDAYAQSVVSIYYALGYKTEKDLAKAAEYATKSAGQRNPLGQYQLGVLTAGGDGVIKDPEKGKSLKVEAIEGLNTMANDPYALAALGAMALRGEGVAKDMKKAAQLYRRSADMGYAPAQILYATMLSKGVGVQKDDDEAMRYMGKASEQNFISQ